MNTKYRIKITQSDFDDLHAQIFVNAPKENGAFMLAGISQTKEVCDILVRRVVSIPPEQFTLQHQYRLDIAPEAVNGLAALCEANSLGVVLCHSHPEDIYYSPTDDFGEQRIFEALRNFIPTTAPTASILLHPTGIYARVWLPNQAKPVGVDEVVVIGDSVRKIHMGKPNTQSLAADSIHNRQELALGKEGQSLLRNTKVAVIGTGGTGSSCAEQLARLGVEDIQLVDYDKFEDTNLSRMYGSKWSDTLNTTVRLKVDILRDHLTTINPAMKVEVIPQHIATTSAAYSMRDRDVIMLCTDEHWGRAVVNQIAYQYFIPTINMGVRIDAAEGELLGALGSVDVLRPGNPCLWCKRLLSAERIATESMPKDARKEKLRKGYINDIDTKAPSIISMNTVITALAVTQFLHLVTGFGENDFAVERINYFITDNTVQPGQTTIQEKCICKLVKGCGDLKPLPTVSILEESLLT